MITTAQLKHCFQYSFGVCLIISLLGCVQNTLTSSKKVLPKSSKVIQSTGAILKASSMSATSEQQAANNGAGSPQGLALDAKHLGLLMQLNHQHRLGFLSSAGWDTHINQGNVTGLLANNLTNLANANVQLRAFFNDPDDLIVVTSEFGRTCAENGTRGTVVWDSLKTQWEKFSQAFGWITAFVDFLESSDRFTENSTTIRNTFL